MKLKFLMLAVLLPSGLCATGALAEDSLSALMQRMRSEQAVRIAYRETRTLALLDQPWLGGGYMYSLPPDIMIKEQLRPERLVMAIGGDDMFYYDPGNDVRHQGTLDEDNPMSLNIAVFKALMTGDQQLLETLYRADFVSLPEQWRMRLKAKNDPDSVFAIEISGLPEQRPQRIVVLQADGDSSEFELHKDAEGGEVAVTAKLLYRELLGSEE